MISGNVPRKKKYYLGFGFSEWIQVCSSESRRIVLISFFNTFTLEESCEEPIARTGQKMNILLLLPTRLSPHREWRGESRKTKKYWSNQLEGMASVHYWGTRIVTGECLDDTKGFPHFYVNVTLRNAWIITRNTVHGPQLITRNMSTICICIINSNKLKMMQIRVSPIFAKIFSFSRS